MKPAVPLIFVLFILSACSTARMVEVQPGVGGVVAMMPENDPDARAKANALMRDNCGSRIIQILGEGEVVVGQITTTNQSVETDKEKDRNQKTEVQNATATTTTENQTEWRITYRCVNQVAAPPPPPPPSPPAH